MNVEFLSVDELTKTIIPQIVSNSQTLDALFLTYNGVSGFDNGTVEQNGLSITIHSENPFPSLPDPEEESIVLAAMAFPQNTNLREAAYRILDEDRKDKQRLQRSLENQTSFLSEFRTKKNLFVLVYAGLSAFQEALGFAKQIKQYITGALVAILTCDCDLDRKTPHLLMALHEDNGINYVIVSWECGGYNPMGRIAKRLIDSWPH